jgi:hypothetical protein
MKLTTLKGSTLLRTTALAAPSVRVANAARNKEPFLDFPRLLRTANVSGAGWVVPAKYYQDVGQEEFAGRKSGGLIKHL